MLRPIWKKPAASEVKIEFSVEGCVTLRNAQPSRGRPLANCWAYRPVEISHRGLFQPRQVQSKTPHGSQNNDLRRYFFVTSL
jgi:hypothetical protein